MDSKGTSLYKIEKVCVVPRLPEKLQFLRELAFNLYWTWDPNSRALFRRLDPELWETVNRNPVLLLGTISQEKLQAAAENEGYLASMERVRAALADYLSRKTWYEQNFADEKPFTIAYFSMEYGLAACLPIYSGGLGVLSGDHLKAASDLGLPLVGVGLAYQQGYFQQYLATDGWQQETFPINDFYNLPFSLERSATGEPLTVSVELPGREVFAQIWRVVVGRVPLYLLDANIPQNSPEDRLITSQLYGGGEEMRIRQEILLGVGGMRALRALGIRPQVCHMNEGHSAFLALERIRTYLEEHPGADFDQAFAATRVGNVFTTHTPVPAGIDRFDPSMVRYYLETYCKSLDLPFDRLMQLAGRKEGEDKFNMAIFAIRMAGGCNAVSKLHSRVSRSMWRHLWPNLPTDEAPIGYVTNGVHVRSWISHDLSELFSRYLHPTWYRNPVDPDIWERIDQIPDVELWRTHERRRERLVTFARKRLQDRLKGLGAAAADIERAAEVLQPDALTIGFARRFAAYKRAYLLFSNKERLRRLLNDPSRPVQIILSGKAHPLDREGKEILRSIMSIAKEEDFRDKIVFIENYDMRIAAYLVQGADVWLNTPRRPREASGTSGMKAAANGALNLSILDGWWDEAYAMNPGIGWAIGKGEENYRDEAEQDRIEAEELYHLLENHVIPLFYQRGSGGVPREWVKMMKAGMKTVCPYFNTTRMVREYFTDYYLPAYRRLSRVDDEQGKIIKDFVTWQHKVEQNWDKVEVMSLSVDSGRDVEIGSEVEVLARVRLGALQTDDVMVQVYYGRVGEEGDLKDPQTAEMRPTGTPSDGVVLYQTSLKTTTSGQMGFTVRVFPRHQLIEHPAETGLIKWYRSDS
ncbi:MAG: alpha-glucan family phosphorylase [candidate division KSB1 bacterium]|nr:alpha-glucan family phosphorylase [candidate division KSB1 bacterium]